MIIADYYDDNTCIDEISIIIDIYFQLNSNNNNNNNNFIIIFFLGIYLFKKFILDIFNSQHSKCVMHCTKAINQSVFDTNMII